MNKNLENIVVWPDYGITLKFGWFETTKMKGTVQQVISLVQIFIQTTICIRTGQDGDVEHKNYYCARKSLQF